MASKSAQESAASSEDIEELLDTVDKNLDRLKTMYEQYFLGIQKQAPTFIHTDIERKLRDLTQLNIRHTGRRYRLATLQQKFGAYNAYWKRTLRQIENGTYIRNLHKIGREAVRTGAEIPEEILAAMPKRMREQVIRDREQAIAIAKRRRGDDTQPDAAMEDLLTLAPEGAPAEPPAADDVAAVISEPTALRRELKTKGGAFLLDEDDGDLDFNAFFANLGDDAADTKPVAKQPAPTPPPPKPAPAPAPILRPPPPATPPPPPAAAKPPSSAPTVPIAVPPPSQVTKPNPVAPGAAAARGPVGVESMQGPFPRPAVPTSVPKVIPPIPTTRHVAPPAPPPQRPPAAAPPPAAKLPPGMTDADVNALYTKYVQAKQLVGEATGPGAREKLIKTINAQAPKIMDQYKSKGVDFSVVVKDNQVIIRAKPKG